jgi:anti-sigma B factor antagonist
MWWSPLGHRWRASHPEPAWDAGSVRHVDLVCRNVIVAGMPALVVTGEIDLASVPMLHGALLRLVADHHGTTVAVDLDGVNVLDDTGLGVLLGAAGRAREQQGDLVVVCTTPRLLQRFQISGLARAIEVRDRLVP